MVQPDPEEVRRRVWQDLAFAARYGRQSLDLLMEMPRSELRMFISAIGDLIKDENTTSED